MNHTTTRGRCFVDPRDLNHVRQLVLDGAVPQRGRGPADDMVADFLHATRSLDHASWHAGVLPALPGQRDLTESADVIILDVFHDVTDNTAGICLHGWDEVVPTSAVVATTELRLDTAAFVVDYLDERDGALPGTVWGPVDRFVPGRDIAIDTLVADHITSYRTVDGALPDLTAARRLGETRFTTRAMLEETRRVIAMVNLTTHVAG